MMLSHVLLSLTTAALLLGNSAGLSNCAISRCPPMDLCPDRDQIICVLQMGLGSTPVDLPVIIHASRFSTEFSDLSASLHQLESELDSGAVRSMTAVTATVIDVGHRFREVLTTTCLIRPGAVMDAAIDLALSNALNYYYRLFMGAGNSLSACPNRNNIQKALDHAVAVSKRVPNYLPEDVFEIMMARENRKTFREQLMLLRHTKNLIDAGRYDVKGIYEDLRKILKDFARVLEETCGILVTAERRNLIDLEVATDSTFNKYVASFYQNGGSPPNECPMRESLVRVLVDARNTGVFNIIHLLESETFEVEFADAYSTLIDLKDRIENGLITDLKDIVEGVANMRENFLGRLQNTACYIPIRGRLYDVIAMGFTDLAKALIALYVEHGGSDSRTGCPDRADIQKMIDLTVTEGTIDPFDQIKEFDEFGHIVSKRDSLRDEITSGRPVDRGLITDRVRTMAEGYLTVLFDQCYVTVPSRHELKDIVRDGFYWNIEFTFCRAFDEIEEI